MKLVSRLLLFTAFASVLVSCKKEIRDEKLLQGIWAKGTSAGDTLVFMKANDRNILRYNLSFNPAYPFYQDVEYKYESGRLSLMLYAPADQNFYTLHSFSWRQIGEVFEIRGSELFQILATTTVVFTYHKL
jgi:hypothetical protein